MAASLTEDGRYRLLVEAITDYAVYMLDPTGIVTSWNPGAARFKGYTAAEIIGEHFSKFYTDEDRATDLPRRALETAVREGKFEAEGWRLRKDGSRFWAYVVIDPIRSVGGEVLGFAKITRDLTERRMAEAELRQSQEQFRLLVEGVIDYAIYLLSPDGIVTNWNRGAERIKGYTADEIVGSHFSRFYTSEDQLAGIPAQALATAEREGRFEREGWRVRKDGSRFRAHVVIDAIRNERGNLIGFAKITRDVTEKYEAERRLEQTREALLQSQKMDAIGQLTGGIAHDFNNLLMAISGSLELMRKRLPDDPKLKSLLENAMKGAQRGTSLTKRMLAFARRQELKREAVDVPELVRGMTELLQGSLGSAVSIETRFSLGMRPVLVDANQMEMAILNLAVNSRDAMPEGGTIIISAREEVVGGEDDLPNGDYVCLSISDSGVGMDAATLKRATEPFFTTKGPGKGTGLGLAMIHGVAEQTGGRFVLRSEQGKGTTAELWLPIALPQPRAQLQAAGARETARHDELLVLVVDDDSLVLTNTVAMLEELGHRVLSAASGVEALALMREHRGAIDLIVTDQVMPRVSGLQLAREAMKQLPDIAIILVSGFAELKPGEADDIPRLAKPFSQMELAESIKQAVSAKSQGARILPLRPGNGRRDGR